MTYQEKKSIVGLVGGILIFTVFCLYRYSQYPEGGPADEFRYWGAFVLWLTLFSVAAHLIIGIAFNVVYRITTREKEPAFADELDKLIELKANRNTLFVFIIGFVAAMGTIAAGQEPRVMFMTLIAFGFLAEITGSVSKLIHYRKGV